MKMENGLQHRLGLLRRGLLQVHPEEKVGIRQQVGHEPHIEVLAVQSSLRGEGKRSDHRFSPKDKQCPGPIANEFIAARRQRAQISFWTPSTTTSPLW